MKSMSIFEFSVAEPVLTINNTKTMSMFLCYVLLQEVDLLAARPLPNLSQR